MAIKKGNWKDSKTGDILYPRTSVDMIEDLTISNPNLLINGDFQVWQAGTSFNETTDTTHKVRYTADQWWTYYEGGTFTVKKGTNGGLVISKNQGLFQILETPLEVGATYTLSAKVNNEIIAYTFVGGSYNAWNETPNGLQYRTWNGYDCVQILGDVSKERTIHWVKLEKGSVATPFVPRLYAEESSLCARYYIPDYKFVTSLTVGQGTQWSIPVMRVAPTTTLKNGWYKNGTSHLSYDSSKLSVTPYDEKTLYVDIVDASLTDIWWAFVNVNLDARIY